MTTYDLLKTIEPNQFNEFVRIGIIAPEWKRWMKVYENFREHCKDMGRMEAYIAAGEKYYTSSDNVRKIVRRMETAV